MQFRHAVLFPSRFSSSNFFFSTLFWFLTLILLLFFNFPFSATSFVCGVLFFFLFFSHMRAHVAVDISLFNQLVILFIAMHICVSEIVTTSTVSL